jgi:hypothetical protein
MRCIVVNGRAFAIGGRNRGVSVFPLYEHNTGARIAYRFVVTVFKKAHPHDPAFPHAHVLVPFTTEWASNDCRLTAVTLGASRLNLDRALLELHPLLRRATSDKGERGNAEKSDHSRKFLSRLEAVEPAHL